MNVGTLWAHIGLNTVSLESGYKKTKIILNDISDDFDKVALGIATSWTGIGGAIIKGVSMALPILNSALEAIDGVRVASVQIGAQLAQLKGPENIEKNFETMYGYATQMSIELRKMDAQTFMNYKGLNAMNQVASLYGQTIDINNQKQRDAFTDVSNAIAMYTNGQDQVMQAYQETRGLIKAEVNQRTQVAKIIDDQIKAQGKYKNGLQDIVALSQKTGQNIFELLQPYLAGIRAASKEIQKTWSAGLSSMSSAVTQLQVDVFQKFYDDAAKYVTGAAAYIQKNSKEIADNLHTIGAAIKSIAELYLGWMVLTKTPVVAKAIYDWIAAFHAAQVAEKQFQDQLSKGNVVALDSAQATKMRAAEQLRAAEATAMATAEELRRAEALAKGLVVEREIAVSKLQSVIANDKLIQSELATAAAATEAGVKRVAASVEHLALIGREMEALAAKSALEKRDAAFMNELRREELVNRQRLSMALKEQTALQAELANIQARAATSAEATAKATTDLAIASKEAAIAQEQLAIATTQNEVAQKRVQVAMNATSMSARVLRGVMTGLKASFDILFALWMGWEIGQFLNKFELVRKAGVRMATSLIRVWKELTFAWQRFKASINPFGDIEEQQNRLAQIERERNKWLKDHEQFTKEMMQDAKKGMPNTSTFPTPALPKPSGGDDEKEREKAARAAERERRRAEQAISQRRAADEAYVKYENEFNKTLATLLKNRHAETEQQDELAYSQGLMDQQTYLRNRQSRLESQLSEELYIRERALIKARELEAQAEKEYAKLPTAKTEKAVYDAYDRTQKAINDVLAASNKLDMTRKDGSETERKALSDSILKYRDLQAAMLESSGRFKEAAQARIESSMNEESYLKMVANTYSENEVLAKAALDAVLAKALENYRAIDQATQKTSERMAGLLEVRESQINFDLSLGRIRTSDALASIIPVQQEIVKVWKEQLSAISPELNPILYDQVYKTYLSAKNKLDETMKAQNSRTVMGGIENALRSLDEKVSNTGKQIEDVMSSAFDNATDALMDFVKTGKLQFNNLVTSVLEMLQRIALQRVVSMAANSLFDGLGSVFSGMTSGLFGGMAPASGPSLAFLPALSAAGGYDIPSGMNPIVQAHQREMILPERQADVIRNFENYDFPEPGEGGGNVEVNIINNSNSKVEQPVTRFDMGRMIIDVVVNDYTNNGRTRSLFGGMG